jgi:hypothetical protein
MLHVTRNLNQRFDQASAEARLADLGIPLKRKAGRLSGGQQAQLALTLALAQLPASQPASRFWQFQCLRPDPRPALGATTDRHRKPIFWDTPHDTAVWQDYPLLRLAGW